MPPAVRRVRRLNSNNNAAGAARRRTNPTRTAAATAPRPPPPPVVPPWPMAMQMQVLPPLPPQQQHQLQLQGRSPPPPYSPTTRPDAALEQPGARRLREMVIETSTMAMSSEGCSPKTTTEIEEDIRREAEEADAETAATKRRRRRMRREAMLHERRCTDVPCCFLLILAILGWAVVAGLGLAWGNPARLIHPTDSLGRQCGVYRPGAYNLTARPFLLFFDLTQCVGLSTLLAAGCATPQVCVSQCPTSFFSYLQLQIMQGAAFQQTVAQNVVCVDGFNVSSLTTFSAVKSAVDSRLCTSYVVKSVPVLGRCIPSAVAGTVSSAVNGLDQLTSQYGSDANVPSDAAVNNATKAHLSDIVSSSAPSAIAKVAADLSRSWSVIAIVIGVSALLGLVWTAVMRLLGGLLIWTTLGMLFVLLASGATFSALKFYQLHMEGAINDYSFQPDVALYFNMPRTWLIIGIALAILLAIFLLVLLFIRPRLRLAVAVIEEASRALGHMHSTLLFPIMPFLLHLLVFALYGTVAIALASSGEEFCLDSMGAQCNCATLGQPTVDCHFVNVTRESNRILGLQVYNLFMFFWLTCFVSALGQVTLAGAFASFYWARSKPRDVPSLPVLKALGLALRYNLGSLAFGSLILAIVRLIRALLDFAEKRLATAQNKVLKAIFWALKCLFWCMDVFLRFLTKNAYIMIAIYGWSFYRSAKESFTLMGRNAIRVIVVGRAASFLMFVGKATITALAGGVTFCYFTGRLATWLPRWFAPPATLYFTLVPVIAVLIGAYFVVDVFFDVYETAVDTIFVCCLEDAERNDGSPDRPYFMSERLQRILGKHNTQMQVIS